MIAALVGRGVELPLRALCAPWLLATRWQSLGSQPAADTVPAPRRSLALGLKVALDEVFFLTELLSASIVAPRHRGRLREELDAAVALFRAHGWLDAPATYHRPPPPLETPARRPRRARGLDFQHLEFESGYEPHPDEPGRERWLGYTPMRTAHAWVLQHTDRPRPWLVCVHAYRMGFPLADFLGFPAAWFHHQLGLNLAFPVLPFHGPRKTGWRTGEGFFSGDYIDTVHMQAQAVWDIRRLLSWVRAEDAPAVGVYGISLGGYTTALLAALEANLDCVIAGIPAVDYGSLARWNLPPVLHRLAERAGITWDTVAELERVISPLALPPRVAHERRFLFAAMADRLVPPHHARDLWRHWEEPRLLWYEGSHVSFGWEASVRAFLREALETTGLVSAA
jgi:hypothetical protein